MEIIEGLSDSANQIIEQFSSLKCINGYFLIGGTALSLSLHHRLSEDLDFCRWVPDNGKVTYAVDAKSIHRELSSLFGEVQMNHLGFSQSNYYIDNPGVRISFYHTDLKQPSFEPLQFKGNILMPPIKVLGGSKIYVINVRDEIRDYYDLYCLLEIAKIDLKDMLLCGRSMSSDVNGKKLIRKFSSLPFDENDYQRFASLKPKYLLSFKEFNIYFNRLSQRLNYL